MATTTKNNTQETLEYKFFKALNNFTVNTLTSFNNANRTTTDLLQAMSDYKKFLSETHYLQILISIKSICERNAHRHQLTLEAIQNISYILEQFPVKPNKNTEYWSGLNFDTIFDACVKYLKDVNLYIIWICGETPFWYRDFDWTYGKFIPYRNNTDQVQPTAYQFDNVKHDTTVENILKMITLSRPTSIQMRGDPNNVFKGPRLLWWAPDPRQTKK